MIDCGAWSGLRLIERIAEGNRNEVWRGELDSQTVAVRRSRRSTASLQWELDLIGHLDSLGFVVPIVIASDDGHQSVDGVVVQRWIAGRPPTSEADWQAVADELARLHGATQGYRQRPGCCAVADLAVARRSVDADLDALPPDVEELVITVFSEFETMATSVIHGDPDPSNLRITADGEVGLLDWDECRVDVAWHDLSNLGLAILDPASHRRAQRLSHAWEAANGWIQEPEYAQRRLTELRAIDDGS